MTINKDTINKDQSVLKLDSFYMNTPTGTVSQGKQWISDTLDFIEEFKELDFTLEEVKKEMSLLVEVKKDANGNWIAVE